MTSKSNDVESEFSEPRDKSKQIYTNIKNINIKYENNKNESIMVNFKDLELLNEIYECKINLEKRKIIPYITDNDLIALNKDNSDILYLRLVKEPINITNNDVINNHQPNNITSNNDSINHLKKNDELHNLKYKHKRHNSDTKNNTNSSLSKIKIKTPVRNSTSKIAEITHKLNKLITINNNDFLITYKTTSELYSVFKIINKNNKISCIGTFDNLVKIQELIANNYDSNTIEYNACRYNIITPKFDNFVSPMFIEIVTNDLKYTTEIFMNTFQYIINNISL